LWDWSTNRTLHTRHKATTSLRWESPHRCASLPLPSQKMAHVGAQYRVGIGVSGSYIMMWVRVRPTNWVCIASGLCIRHYTTREGRGSRGKFYDSRADTFWKGYPGVRPAAIASERRRSNAVSEAKRRRMQTETCHSGERGFGLCPVLRLTSGRQRPARLRRDPAPKATAAPTRAARSSREQFLTPG